MTAEKENEESLGISEQAEEQVALEPALAKKKRKKRKDDLEQEVENLPEEMAVPSKIAEEGKSSKKSKRQKCSLSNVQIQILYKDSVDLKMRTWVLICITDLPWEVVEQCLSKSAFILNLNILFLLSIVLLNLNT